MSDHRQLEEYYARGYLTPAQYQAGKWFADDWHAAHRSGMRHASMEPGSRRSGPAQGFNMSDAERERGRRATKAIGDLRFVVIAVCCHGKTAREWALEDSRRPEEGMPILRFGLDALVKFYRVIGEFGAA